MLYNNVVVSAYPDRFWWLLHTVLTQQFFELQIPKHNIVSYQHSCNAIILRKTDVNLYSYCVMMYAMAVNLKIIK